MVSAVLFLSVLLCPLWARKIGFALSGGGARGFAQIGIIKVLEENGIYPDYIAGTSIGSVVGALYAMGYSANQIEELALDINWQELFNDSFERRDLNIGQKRWPPYGNAIFEIDEDWKISLPQSVFSANDINLELFRLFASTSSIERFEDLPIPFACVATNLLTGKMRIFEDGQIVQAVKASMSIPSIMKPFELGDSLYIDGGISQNLPVQQVKNMGADYVISFKTSSGLRTKDSITNLFQVFDQTVNISITNNVEESLAASDFMFDPPLDQFSASGFRQVQAIIDAGEAYARSRLPELIEIAKASDGRRFNRSGQALPKLYTLRINSITIAGNTAISSAKIKEYLGLNTGQNYTLNNIVQSCKAIWNRQLFHYVYPTLEYDGKGYHLYIHLKERQRKHLAINSTYTSEDGLVAGAVLAMHNYVSRNSSLLAEVRLGGKYEVNVDFVRNFGDYWGIYYRLFPYLNEKTLYIYEDHNKVNSIGSLETGLTSGLGLYAGKAAVLESFAFRYHTKLYRKIADSEALNRNYSVTGLGLKAYHESLDDFYFPMNGKRILSKLSFSRDIEKDDVIHGKYIAKAEAYYPIYPDLSLKLGFAYGANFDKDDNLDFDPFYLGGSDGYYGYAKYEMSAPFYKTYTLGLRLKAGKSTFLDLGGQGLNYANSDVWSPDQKIDLNAFMSIGYDSVAGPLRLTAAYSSNDRMNAYLNLGYYIDLFEFSRR